MVLLEGPCSPNVGGEWSCAQLYLTDCPLCAYGCVDGVGERGRRLGFKGLPGHERCVDGVGTFVLCEHHNHEVILFCLVDVRDGDIIHKGTALSHLAT